MPKSLVGIVGPNGCGKSNVIDAVRWVMGESSAKTLRGDSMDDVIFNGSAERKPVNKASVELVFDNSKGQAPGAYGALSEISIRRELLRDGVSKYFINNDKCRRKDIQDIFLGTGLGPRSYSIIEQGMVGRIVESKPEELRVLIEEAAGISKYKDRRRETENRIRHTRDNLSRVDDIISELETQLRRLKRQANDAERYKVLKAEQRDLEVELKSRRWHDLDQQVQGHDASLADLTNEFERQVAEQRGAESRIESLRQEQTALTDVLNEIQARYYGLGGEVSAVEQAIEHRIATRQQQEEELARLTSAQQEAETHLALDKERLQASDEAINALHPQHESKRAQHEAAQAEFAQANEQFQAWQTAWEAVNQQVADPEREREVQRARIEEQTRRMDEFHQRHATVKTTLEVIDDKLNTQEMMALRQSVSEVDADCDQLEQQLTQLDQRILEARDSIDGARTELDQVRLSHQEDAATLKALRVQASEHDDAEVGEWLTETTGATLIALREVINVEPGWETAVDTVLNNRAQAHIVDDDAQWSGLTNAAKGPRAWLTRSSAQASFDETLKLPTLLSKIKTGGAHVGHWLAEVYCAESLSEARQHIPSLRGGQSIITPVGEWFARDWALIGQANEGAQGMLAREALMVELAKKVELSQTAIDQLVDEQAVLTQTLESATKQRNEVREVFAGRSRERTELHNRFGRLEARSTELLAQQAQLNTEREGLDEQLKVAESQVQEAKRLMQAAEAAAQAFETQRVELSSQRAGLVEALEMARRAERETGDQFQVAQLELERHRAAVQSLGESIERLQTQLTGQHARQAELADLLSGGEDPSADLRAQLKQLLDQRLEVEKELSGARNQLAEFETTMRSADQERAGFDRQSQVARDALEAKRMERQELLVRRDTIAEELSSSVEQMRQRMDDIDVERPTQEIEERLNAIRARLERIGAVNLVAIEEYEQCSERKQYLDKQQQDLTEAMETLEAAIQKIDRETKTLFKDTFEALNNGFKAFFPKLFGGGQAYLELTSNDLLETGVAVMARPPGKRNSTIHLLSGGEKALTAVSLLFAFFELNPSPFCVLDEVDAPLDDANVERYANLLQQLSKKTQLLFITHNKITMEVADILVGVTMAQAGVSRLIAVDVAEAVAMNSSSV